MARHKQMPGMTYQIISQDERQAELEYTYLCPYCMRRATVHSVVYSPNYERLETGGFYDASSLLRKLKSILPREKYSVLYSTDSKLTPRWLYSNFLKEAGYEPEFYRAEGKRRFQNAVIPGLYFFPVLPMRTP